MVLRMKFLFQFDVLIPPGTVVLLRQADNDEYTLQKKLIFRTLERMDLLMSD